MKIQTFYGEYSLEHWIRLMTEGNILLPEYQRPFKWREDKVIELIESFKEDQFIPPVIIAREGNKNFVLDGQQRLTSLLLVDLKKYPKSEDWKYDSEKNHEFNDSNKFSDLTTDPLENDDKDQFLKNKFLGFSFITLDLSPKEQKVALAKIFYSINTQAEPLTGDEKMDVYKTIYPDSKILIENGFFADKFQTQGNYVNVFIRTLGYVLQYGSNAQKIVQSENTENLALVIESIFTKEEVRLINEKNRNGKPSDGINFYKVISDSKAPNDFKDSFKDILKGKPRFSDLLVKIHEKLNELSQKPISDQYKFNSIVYSDMIFFGFLYFYLFGKDVQDVVNKPEELEDMLNKLLKEGSKYDNNKQPNNSKNLNARMIESVNIYLAHIQALQGENNVNP